MSVRALASCAPPTAAAATVSVELRRSEGGGDDEAEGGGDDEAEDGEEDDAEDGEEDDAEDGDGEGAGPAANGDGAGSAADGTGTDADVLLVDDDDVLAVAKHRLSGLQSEDAKSALVLPQDSLVRLRG